MGIIMNLRRSQMMVTEKDYIPFVDPVVAQICADNWGDGKGITYKQAAAVTSIGTVFKGNAEIASFDELEYFTGVTYITTSTSASSGGGAFYNCASLGSIKLPASCWCIGDFSFQGCSALASISTPAVTQVNRGAFSGCSALEEITLPLATTVKGLGGSGLQRIYLPSVTVLNELTKNYNLQLLDCGPNLATIATYTFWQMTTGQTVFICRATTPPTLANNNNLGFCSAIYVPDASVADYQAATNWSTYAAQIRPLSEYNG